MKSWLYLGVFLSVSCSTLPREGASRSQELERASRTFDTKVDVTLSNLAGVPHEIYASQREGLRSSEPGVAYKVIFPQMRQDDFESLRKRYSQVSQVRYVPGTDYELQDFLSPAIQASINHHFKIQALEVPSSILEKLKTKYPKVTFATEGPTIFAQNNCWSSAYEVARLDAVEYHIFFAENDLIQPVLENRQYFEEISLPNGWWSDDKTMKSLLPFDVLTISDSHGDQPIRHMAIFIDDGLFFEKTGTADKFASGFVFFQNMKNYYGTDSRYRVYRRTETKLPAPSQIFSLAALEPSLFHGNQQAEQISAYLYPMEGKNADGVFSLSRIRNFPFVFDEMGRARMPEEAYDPAAYR